MPKTPDEFKFEYDPENNRFSGAARGRFAICCLTIVALAGIAAGVYMQTIGPDQAPRQGEAIEHLDAAADGPDRRHA